MDFERSIIKAVNVIVGERKRATFMNGSLYVMTDMATANKIVNYLRSVFTIPISMRPAIDPPGNIYIFDFTVDG